MSDDAQTPTPMPTPNDCDLPRRRSDFATFAEAIDYAARSEKGLNFHDMRGTLERVYPYSEMRADAMKAVLTRDEWRSWAAERSCSTTRADPGCQR